MNQVSIGRWHARSHSAMWGYPAIAGQYCLARAGAREQQQQIYWFCAYTDSGGRSQIVKWCPEEDSNLHTLQY